MLRSSLKSLRQGKERCLAKILRRSNCSSAPKARGSTFVDTRHGHGPRPDELFFDPNFLSYDEQYTLLSAALRRLDSFSSARSRRMRKSRSHLLQTDYTGANGQLLSLFHADECYDFEEGHYDGVIKNYREMHVTSWLPQDISNLSPIFSRINSLIPKVPTQTHILHLGTDGEILPHVDNVEASGTWILGISLGAGRVLRVESKEDPNECFDIFLPSGSVYIQRDRLRYDYKHSVPLNVPFRGEIPARGQRVSIMIRDVKRVP